MMITIYLHGIAKRYGESFNLDVHDPREAVRALALQLPGFEDMVRENEWHILRGPLDRKVDDSEETVMIGFGDETEMHLIPAIRGAGSGGGAFTFILGVILVVVGIVGTPFTAGGSTGLIAAGVGLMVGGIIQMTMKIPGADTDTESADNKASFLFSGPKNQSTQGVAIPRGYGRARSGSIVISAGLYAEKIT